MSVVAPRRTDAEPGASGGRSAFFERVNGDLAGAAEPVGAALLDDVLLPLDQLDLALERGQLGRERGVLLRESLDPGSRGGGLADLAGEDDHDPDASRRAPSRNASRRRVIPAIGRPERSGRSGPLASTA